MEWIKLTPDTMPPDLEPVMVTIRYNEGKKHVYPEVRWNKNKNCWEMVDEHKGTWWKTNVNITHWAMWPEPAED